MHTVSNINSTTICGGRRTVHRESRPCALVPSLQNTRDTQLTTVAALIPSYIYSVCGRIHPANKCHLPSPAHANSKEKEAKQQKCPRGRTRRNTNTFPPPGQGARILTHKKKQATNRGRHHAPPRVGPPEDQTTVDRPPLRNHTSGIFQTRLSRHSVGASLHFAASEVINNSHYNCCCDTAQRQAGTTHPISKERKRAKAPKSNRKQYILNSSSCRAQSHACDDNSFHEPNLFTRISHNSISSLKHLPATPPPLPPPHTTTTQ